MDVLPTKVIKVRSLEQPVALHATGDWHVGEAGCSEAKLRRNVEAIAKEPRSVVLLMGDLGGFIAPDDRRWDPASVAEGLSLHDLSDWGHILIRRIADIARPIEGKIIGCLEGNHEAVYSVRHHCNTTKRLGEALKCPPLGYSVLFTLRFQAKDEHVDLRVFATHGAGAAATPGGKLNRLVRTIQMVDADLVLMGHVHCAMSETVARLRQDDNQISSAKQLGVITGTYLQTYCLGHSGYGERKNYSVVPICHPRIVIVPRGPGGAPSMTVGWV